MYVAILGSRHISSETFTLVRAFARSVALAGHLVISGGARGADHAALLGALDAGTTPVAVLPQCLQHQPKEVQSTLRSCDLVEHPELVPAGYIAGIDHRNRELVEGADLLVIFHWGSRGSRSYIRHASKIGRPFRALRVPYGG